MLVNHKRQRTHVDAIPFSQAERWLLRGDKNTASIVRMAVDNERGFLYLAMIRSAKAYETGLVIKRIGCACPSRLVQTLVEVIPELKVFPPGVVPVIGAYADTEGEALEETLMPDMELHIVNMEVESVSGQLVCHVEDYDYLIKVNPNGTMNFIHQLRMPAPTCLSFDHLTCSSSRGKCIVINRVRLLHELEWKGVAYYIPRPIGHPQLPRDVCAFVMNDRYICAMTIDGEIHCMIRDRFPESTDTLVFETGKGYKLYYKLVWCGPTHILFAMEETIKDKPISIHMIQLATRQHTCLVTDIPTTFTSEFDFCVAQLLARGPSILIRSRSEFRTIPLPSLLSL